MASAHPEVRVTGTPRQFRVFHPQCDLHVLELDIVLEDISREHRNWGGIKVTARALGCKVGTGSHNKWPQRASSWPVPTERQERQGHPKFRAVTQACDIQCPKIDVMLEDIRWDGGNLVDIKVTARVAGCEAGTCTDDERPRMVQTWPVLKWGQE